jgi:hypothetical protein
MEKKRETINRRMFAEISLFTVAAVAASRFLQGCTSNKEELTDDEMKNYYVNNKVKYMGMLDGFEKSVHEVLERYVEQSRANQVITISRQKFEAFLPQIPYIGGEKNRLSRNLFGAAYKMQMIPSLEQIGFTTREIGKIGYETMESYYEKIPWYKKWFVVHFAMTAGNYRKGARRSQQRKYPEDWVYEYIEGDGKNFDLGVNFTECGIAKLYKKYGMEHYLPYLCICDYATYGTFGVELKRSQTIGNGAPLCDFRFKKNGVPPKGWPPETLSEFKRAI